MQKKLSFQHIALMVIAITYAFQSQTRSALRKPDKDKPSIRASWSNNTEQQYISYSWHLKKYPIFEITAEASMQHQLPNDMIEDITTPDTNIQTKELKRQLESLVHEIQSGKETYTHFHVLHKRDFNMKKMCGLIVCKFKEYPFVVKLSLETPETFINPHCKGMVPMFFHFMSGGSNRHLTGLTRIPNLHRVHSYLEKKPDWVERVKTPRKWFWIPKTVPYITLIGENIGPECATYSNKLPAIYAIIADEINTKQQCDDLSFREKCSMIMELCNTLNCIIDPHENNFVFERTPQGKVIISIIDTEHFPTMVGLPDTLNTFNNHFQWYLSLACKCFNDMFVSTKKKRMHVIPV